MTRHSRHVATDPADVTIDDCTCVRDCGNTADACNHAGHFHTHPRDENGELGPCPVHPSVPAAP